jgi:hypothetical protein
MHKIENHEKVNFYSRSGIADGSACTKIAG